MQDKNTSATHFPHSTHHAANFTTTHQEASISGNQYSESPTPYKNSTSHEPPTSPSCSPNLSTPHPSIFKDGTLSWLWELNLFQNWSPSVVSEGCAVQTCPHPTPAFLAQSLLLFNGGSNISIRGEWRLDNKGC